MASHDLQEPLRKITVFGERLKEQNANLAPESADFSKPDAKGGRPDAGFDQRPARFLHGLRTSRPTVYIEMASGVLEDLEGRIEMVKGRVEVVSLPVS